MVDWQKRVENFEGNKLEPGEQIQNVLVTQPYGALSQQTTMSSFGLLGALIGNSMKNKKEAKLNLVDSQLAQTYPKALTYLAKTNTRIILYSQTAMSGKPKEYLGDYRNNEITGIDFNKGRLVHSGIIHFSDGGSVAVEIPRGQKHEEFINSL